AALAYYYQQFLAQLPKDFPSAIIIGIVFGLVVTYAPVRTFLQEPDLVFLMPAEHDMEKYFRNSLIYSFVVQLYLVFLVAAVIGPLYFNAFDARTGKVYMATVVILIIFKGWNMLVNWWVSYERDKTVQRIYIMVRLILNIFIFYMLVELNIIFALLGTIVFLAMYLFAYRRAKKQDGISWDVLVENDLRSRQFFYRIANMFTDVPHIKSPIKERKWLVRLISRVPFEQKQTYNFLYRLSFARSGDYFGIYLRLLVIGGIFIYLIPNLWMKLAVMLLFLYLSSFQLVTLYDHYRTIIWVDLYPVESVIRQESLVQLLIQLTVIKTIIFSMLFLITTYFASFILALAIGILFTFLFVRGYLERKTIVK
ncbi:MAG TPA: ABC transporter permease, partial [Bacillota bacterium]|nr:ABC transporter permease [Bacillota bacterium]